MSDCYWWWDPLPLFLNKAETKTLVCPTSLRLVLGRSVLMDQLGVKEDLTWSYVGKPAYRFFDTADK